MALIFMHCSCCQRYDGLSSGGCYHCTSRTYCTCGHILSCSCGRAIALHVCPNVVVIGTLVPIQTEPDVGQ